MPDEIFIGGAPVVEAELTRSWGLTPGSGNITMPGSVTGMCGTDITVNLGGLVFYGVVTDDGVEVASTKGTMTKLQVADNRIKLQWDDIYCAFNMAAVREDNPATPGIDRQKRYWHILPENWDAQIKTWTAAPYTAHQIISMIIAADTVSYPWTCVFHSAQEAPVYGIDANQGTTKLGTILQEITEHQGLLFTLSDEYELTWARKGEGTIPPFPSNSSEWKLGEALNANDTNVRIVGDRNRYEDLPVELDVDWLTWYEQFWAEPFWIKEVGLVFGPFTDDMSGRAALAAKARAVTVREYATAKEGGGGLAATYEDHGMWGEVCRMEIPAWTYINDIVFKAYRVPYDYEVNGIDLDSIEMIDGLLAAVDHDINTGVISYKTPREYYPDTKAYVIAQGQQLDMLDPRTQTVITAEQLATARTIWTAINKFNLDIKNKVVIFEHAVFVPGVDGAALFIFPNRGVTGIADTDPLYNIAVPNAAATFAHAAVQAAMVWDAEKYSKRYGSGVRKGGKYCRGLNYHALMDEGVFAEEVDYADGNTADEKSDEYSAAIIAQLPTYPSGEFKRMGATGTVLTSMIDRSTTHLSFAEGLSEVVTLTKEKAGSFENDRQLDRKQRAHDLFPGQSSLRESVKTLELISKVTKGVKRHSPTDYSSLSAVLQKPIGAVDGSPTTFDSTDTWPAGQPVFVDGTNTPSGAGTIFKGIVVADQSTGQGVVAATQGNVPVRVSSHFKIVLSATSTLSKLAERLAGCGGADTTTPSSQTVDIPMAIKSGMMLYSVPSSGLDYVTPFDFTSIFEGLIATAMAAISGLLSGAFAITPTETIPAVTITDGALSVSSAITTFPTLSFVDWPSLSFDDLDPCKPLSSGGAAVLSAFGAYDFSGVIAAVNTAIGVFNPRFAASLTLPSMDTTAIEAAIEAAFHDVLCQLATTIDEVISNLDKIMELIDAILEDYLTRQPVGIAQADVATTITDVILIPVNLNISHQMAFPQEMSDMLMTILQDIPLFGLAPAQTVANLFQTIIPLIFGGVNSLIGSISDNLDTVVGELANGIQGALTTVKSAMLQTVSLISQEHAQVQSLLSQFAGENQDILDYAEQYMLKNAVSVSNLIINYLKAPYAAAPKMYLLPSPYAGLDLLDPTSLTDFCLLATALTTLAGKLAGATALPDLSTASFIDDQNLQLGTGDNMIALRTTDVDGNGPVYFQQIPYCNPDDPTGTYAIMVLASAPFSV